MTSLESVQQEHRPVHQPGQRAVKIGAWLPLQTEIKALRLAAWRESAPWLLTKYPEGADAFDTTSTHAVLRKDGLATGAVRFTIDAPEIRQSGPRFNEFALANPAYAEIGRFVMCGSRRERVLSSAELLISAGRDVREGHSFFGDLPTEHKLAGLMAICRTERLSFFRRFGFVPAFETPEYIEHKRAAYWLIHADWSSMIHHIQAGSLIRRGSI